MHCLFVWFFYLEINFIIRLANFFCALSLCWSFKKMFFSYVLIRISMPHHMFEMCLWLDSVAHDRFGNFNVVRLKPPMWCHACVTEIYAQFLVAFAISEYTQKNRIQYLDIFHWNSYVSKLLAEYGAQARSIPHRLPLFFPYLLFWWFSVACVDCRCLYYQLLLLFKRFFFLSVFFICVKIEWRKCLFL